MDIKRIILLCGVLLVFCAISCDRSDREDHSSPSGKEYTRIVSLAPNITETLYALGLGERVAGVSRFCKYPPEAMEKPKVGGFLDINYEALAGLRPDLVILLPEHEEAKKRLEGLGIPTLTVHNRVVREILETISTIGKTCGAEARADSLVHDIESRLETVRKRAENRPKPRVLLVVERKVGGGTPGALYAAGPDTFYDELIQLAGGQNAYRGPAIAYPEIATEGILRLDPEIVADVIPTLDEQGVSPETARADWNGIPSLSAVKSGRVHIIGESYAVIPGPRFILMLEELARVIHPEN